MEVIGGNAKGQVLAIGIDLRDTERLSEVLEGRRVQLDAVDVQRVFLVSHVEVEHLRLCQWWAAGNNSRSVSYERVAIALTPCDGAIGGLGSNCAGRTVEGNGAGIRVGDHLHGPIVPEVELCRGEARRDEQSIRGSSGGQRQVQGA